MGLADNLLRQQKRKEGVIVAQPSADDLRPSKEEARRDRIDAYRESHPSEETRNHVLGTPSHSLYDPYYSRWIRIS